MPATIRNPRLGLALATTVAATCALQAAPAWADPVTTAPVGDPVPAAVLLDPSATFDPQAPGSQVVAARHAAAGATDAITLFGRREGTSWATAPLVFDPATVVPQGAPATTWAGDPLVYVRAEPVGGACSSGSGIYRSASFVLEPLAATAVLVLEDEAASRIDAPAATTSDGEPVLAALERTFADGAACASGTAPTATVPVLAVGNSLATSPLALPDAAVARSAPALAADPSAVAGIAVAAAWTEVGADGMRVIVRRCTRPSAAVGPWTCSDDEALRPLGPFVAPAGAPPTPAVAVAADGSIHVAFAVGGGGGREARYARAAVIGPDAWSWSAARRVDQAAPGQAGEQLVPTLAVAANGRADVAFLDTAGTAPGSARAYQRSFAPDGTAGEPVALGPEAALPLVGGDPSPGDRIAALALPSAATGDLAAVWPTAVALVPSALVDAQLVIGTLAHGTTPPAAATAPLETGKGRPLTIADLLRGLDADGDPVEVEQAGPIDGRTAHGTIDAVSLGSGRYTPDPGYAGADAIALRARALPAAPDDPWGAPSERPIAVTNTLPLFGPVPASVVVPESGVAEVMVGGVDDDPTDVLAAAVGPSSAFTYESIPTPGGVRLRIRSTGVRTDGPTLLRIRLRDTTATTTETRTLSATVAPAWRTPTLAVTTTVSLYTVRLDAVLTDPDPWANRTRARDDWVIEWGDGTRQAIVDRDADGRVGQAHIYKSTNATYTIRVVATRHRSQPSGTRPVPWQDTVTLTPDVARLLNVTSARASRGLGDVRVRLVPRTPAGGTYWIAVYRYMAGGRTKLLKVQKQLIPPRTTSRRPRARTGIVHVKGLRRYSHVLVAISNKAPKGDRVADGVVARQIRVR